MRPGRVRVSKLDAARSQLDTAIELWFFEKDAASIHTLVTAAYQILHDVAEERGTPLQLLYDSNFVRDEVRVKWLRLVRKPANFFKHARKDPDEVIEYDPETPIPFFVFSILGLQKLGLEISETQSLLTLWIVVNKPEFSPKDSATKLSETNRREDLAQLRNLTKRDFFERVRPTPV